MGRRLIERRLRHLSIRLRGLRDELRLIDEQLAQLTDEAADTGIRALVAESSGAGVEHRHAQGHADAMGRHRNHVVAEIAALEVRQDQLLDSLTAG